MQEPIHEQLGKIQSLKNTAKKMVARAMKDDTERDCKPQKNYNIFQYVKSVQKDGKDVEGGQCIKSKRGRSGLSATDSKRI